MKKIQIHFQSNTGVNAGNTGKFHAYPCIEYSKGNLYDVSQLFEINL